MSYALRSVNNLIPKNWLAKFAVSTNMYVLNMLNTNIELWLHQIVPTGPFSKYNVRQNFKIKYCVLKC